MRVLLVTPFSPCARHDHAAADTLVPLIHQLAKHHELHVFTPDARRSEREVSECAVQIWTSGAQPASRLRAVAGARPYWLRHDWPRQATTEVASLSRRLRPDVVHCEYLQTAEVVSAVSLPTILTLHDLSTDVMERAFRSATGVRKAYRLAEWLRTIRFEASSVAAATVPVALSRRDASHFERINPEIRVIPPGITLPDRPWSVGECRSSSIVFTGAMWRIANQAAAQRLVERIMPLVWTRVPSATLRIVGADPPPGVLAFQRDPRVVVVGRVESFEAEMRRASVVACPTVLGGGVLMKLINSLALGVPVVADEPSVASLGLASETVCTGRTDDEFAEALARILESPKDAAVKAARARASIASICAWESVTEGFASAYARALEIAA